MTEAILPSRKKLVDEEDILPSIPTPQVPKNILPSNVKGRVRQRKNKCGNPRCKCAKGQLHGPYNYLVWRDPDTKKPKEKYLGKSVIKEQDET